MITAVSGHGNTAHSAAQPLRLWFGLPVAIGQASEEMRRGTQRMKKQKCGACHKACGRKFWLLSFFSGLVYFCSNYCREEWILD
jgi:hypothetical protein